jgi:uncharacterized protein (TIGR02611 family)
MHSFGTLLRFIWRSSKRAVVFVVGVVLIVVGLIMFVTPGPGIVLLVAGLAVLATEFAWAEHLLDKAKEQAAKAGKSAQRLPGVSRATSVVGGVVVRVVPRRWRRGASSPDAAYEGSAAEGAEVETDEGDHIVEVVEFVEVVEVVEVERPRTVDLTDGASTEIGAGTTEPTNEGAGRLPTGHRARRAGTGRHWPADGDPGRDATADGADAPADADRR